MLGNCFYEHPYCTDSDILLLCLLLTNVAEIFHPTVVKDGVIIWPVTSHHEFVRAVNKIQLYQFTSTTFSKIMLIYYVIIYYI